MLPDFIIVGAAKSGTTSLYHYLEQHPHIHMSRLKETNYYACEDDYVKQHWENYPFLIKTRHSYEELFINSIENGMSGEASPIYLESPVAASNIFEDIPQCKIIIILRNPVHRAYSGYLMHFKYGSNDVKEATPTEGIDTSTSIRYIRSSFYYENVKRYIDIFGKDQVRVLIFEEFIQSMHQSLAELCLFIGVDSHFKFSTSESHNEGKVPKNRFISDLLMSDLIRNRLGTKIPKSIIKKGKSLWKSNMVAAPGITADIEESLYPLFVSDVEKLKHLIEKDLSIWSY